MAFVATPWRTPGSWRTRTRSRQGAARPRRRGYRWTSPRRDPAERASCPRTPASTLALTPPPTPPRCDPRRAASSPRSLQWHGWSEAGLPPWYSPSIKRRIVEWQRACHAEALSGSAVQLSATMEITQWELARHGSGGKQRLPTCWGRHEMLGLLSACPLDSELLHTRLSVVAFMPRSPAAPPSPLTRYRPLPSIRSFEMTSRSHFKTPYGLAAMPWRRVKSRSPAPWKQPRNGFEMTSSQKSPWCVAPAGVAALR